MAWLSRSPLDLQEQDRNFQLHPFTNHADLHAAGTHIVLEGHGCYFVDEAGRRILDGLAGLWCVNLGYSSKAVVRAVTQQLERLPYYPSFFNSTTEPPIMVAKFLAEKAPERVNRTIFSNSGSEANETALKADSCLLEVERTPGIRKRSSLAHSPTMA